MIIELHLLQSFSPANLNRDDTGSPKDCEFGGVRRARVSSQCWKRAMREYFAALPDIVPEQQLGVRTKQVGRLLRDIFVSAGKPEEEINTAVARLEGEYLVFIGRRDAEAIAAACLQNWPDLISTATPAPTASADPQSEPAAKASKSAKQSAKSKADAGEPKNVLKEALKILPAVERAADIALFGRMIADLPQKNIDAAAQVAHAISTHKVSMDIDYYTALDDLQGNHESGAAMIGSNEFNSACFYRYLNLDTGQLSRNLGGDQDLVARATRAYVRSAVEAIPKAKQNSMAARNPPLFVLAVARQSGAWNLANAFLRPARASAEKDLLAISAEALLAHWNDLRTMYSDQEVSGAWRCSISALQDVTSPSSPEITSCSSVAGLYDAVLAKVA
jgi:CRISPR system Cascade subunit CasC